MQPKISMSTLGKNGRFGNQIFQYAFLKIYAKENDLQIETPNWIGQYLFGHKDPYISSQLPVVSDSSNNLEESYIANAKEVFKNVDFCGYFQYNTSYYANHKNYFRSLFKPVPEILNKMNVAVDRLRSKGKTIVGLHLRRGDFGYGPYFIAPSEWYKEWLSSLWSTLEEPVLFIASDEIEKVVKDFAIYNPIAAKDLDIDLPEATFYPDFYLLGQCDIVAISNSSFSFAASMLNEKGKLFVRPQLETKKMIAFDPWNSKPVFEDKNIFNLAAGNYLNILENYKKHPGNELLLKNVRLIRRQIAEQWLSLPTDRTANEYSGEIGKVHQALLDSGIKYEPLTDSEEIFVNDLVTEIAKGFMEPNAINYILAAMLYRRADRLPLQYEGVPIPKWFLSDYLKFMLSAPNYFQEIGEVDGYYKHIEKYTNVIYKKIFENQTSEIWKYIALLFAQFANFIPLYFTTVNLKDVYIKRGDIIEFALNQNGYCIDYIFPERPAERAKIRLGILNAHFNPQTETFTTIPAFEYLDREKFEIILYATNINGSTLEKYCQSRADRLVKLPNDLPSQVPTIRADDLDILLIGTNVSAVTNPITLLAVHRLARVQVTSVSSPVTTGIKNIDYYISGSLTDDLPDNQTQYREKLITIYGSAHCFNYKLEQENSKIKCHRNTLGIPDKSIVFISGANFYKIIPELRETWAKIIASVPNSILILYPLGAAWSHSYPAIPFVNKMRAILAKYGVDKNRLIILKPIPSRTEVKEWLKLGDIYLDSYPYSGANSTVDSLEVGLPTIVMDGSRFGNSFRSKQASALLKDLQIPDLIADSEKSYIKLAINLASNAGLRQQKREEIGQKMQSNPRFLDSRYYSAQIGNVLQKIFQEWQDLDTQERASLPNETTSSHLLENPIDSPQFLSILSGCLNLYEIDPEDRSVIAELRILRSRLANFWLNSAPEHLEKLDSGNAGKAHQMLVESDFKNQPLLNDEQSFANELTINLAKGIDPTKANNYRMAAMLYSI